MTGKIRTQFCHYGEALLFTAAAILVRWLLSPWLGNYLLLPPVYGAVALSVWVGGYRPALLAAGLGYLACDWLFIEPAAHFGFYSLPNLIGFGTYALSCLAIISLGEAMHLARRAAAARQRQLEQEIERRAQSQRVLDAFLQSSPFGMALLDEKLRYLVVNRPLAEMNGMPAENHIGKTLAEVVPDLVATATPVFEHIVRTGQPVLGKEFEGETPKAPGVRRFWEVNWFPLFSENGHPAGSGLIVQEVTDRKRDENALRELNQQLQIITDSMSALVTRCSRDLRYVWVSRSYALWFGQPPAELVGRSMRDIMGQEAFEQLRPYFEQVLAGHVVRFEARVPMQGAGSRWLSAVYTPILDMQGVCDSWVAVISDIDDQKRAEQALRTSEERFRRTFECGMVPMGIWAVSGTIVEANDALLTLIGYTRDELNAGKISWQNITPPDQLALDERALRQIRERGVSTPFEKEYIHKDGRHIPILIAGASFSHTAESGVFFAIDLTERKRVEQELRRLNAELRAADRRKDEFLATLAHELRNPLAPIRNAAHVIRAKSPDILELVWARDVIERQVGQMARLLEDLLDVSRITRNKLELRKSQVTLSEVVESAVETSRPLIEGGGHELTVTLPPEPVHLNADPVRLAQVFSNLLNNAAKYTERGGRIRLTAERRGAEVCVSVRDNGIGIMPEMLPRLFEMFSQAKPALERSQGGLGIGLSLAKGLVEMHGGMVQAHSDGPGTGSEFVVRLPIGVALPVPRPPPGALEEAPAAGRRIVIADDNRDAADSLAMMLTMMGHQVRTASDGQEAVEAVEAFRPDVVLLDIGMPRLNGYQAARRIRAQPWGKDIMLVALTGWGQEEDKRRAYQAGFTEHMVKPVEPAALATLLRTDVPPKQKQ